MPLLLLKRIPIPLNWELSFANNRVTEITIDGKYVVTIPTLKEAHEEYNAAKAKRARSNAR